MTTFTLPTERGERISQALASRVCTTDDGSYIRRSNGRCKAGRPYKYTVHMAEGGSFVITAFNDEQAVEKANAKAPFSKQEMRQYHKAIKNGPA